MDLNNSELRDDRPQGPDDLAAAMLAAYRAALHSMGNCGLSACPPSGIGLERSLTLLAENLAKTVTPPLIQETEIKVERYLREWGRRHGGVLPAAGGGREGNPDDACPRSGVGGRAG